MNDLEMLKSAAPQNQPNNGGDADDSLDSLSAADLAGSLEEILYAVTEETYDPDLVDAYLNALDRKSPMPEKPDPEVSLAGLQRKCESLFARPVTQAQQAPRHPRRLRRWTHVLLAVVLSIIVIFGSMVAVQAAGADVFGALAKWTDEMFSFGRLSNDTDDAAFVSDATEAALDPIDQSEPLIVTTEYPSLQEALDHFGFGSVPLAPTWIPGGYEQLPVEVIEMSKETSFNAGFISGDNMISINFNVWTEPIYSYIVKDENPVSIYETSGIEHYIMSNNSDMTAVWMNGNIECFISGPITKDELLKMVDSIYGG